MNNISSIILDAIIREGIFIEWIDPILLLVLGTIIRLKLYLHLYSSFIIGSFANSRMFQKVGLHFKNPMLVYWYFLFVSSIDALESFHTWNPFNLKWMIKYYTVIELLTQSKVSKMPYIVIPHETANHYFDLHQIYNPTNTNFKIYGVCSRDVYYSLRYLHFLSYTQ